MSSKNIAEKVKKRLGSPNAQRLIVWLGHLIVVTIVGMVLIPYFRANPNSIHEYFKDVGSIPKFVGPLLLSIILVWILFKLFNPRTQTWRSWKKNPPVWLAWCVAFFLIAVADHAWGLGPNEFKPEWWHWLVYGLCPVLSLVFVRWLKSPDEQKTEDTSSTDPNPLTTEALLRDPQVLKAWLLSEKPAEVDLIGTQRIANRLAEYLQTRDGNIGLVGSYGSGKSTVIKMIKQQLEKNSSPTQPKILFVEQSCWGFEDASGAVQQILSHAVQEVSKETDCFSLRALPESYRKTFSAGGDWLRTLTDLVIPSSDPVVQFRKLSENLELINAKLVVVVEDLDRTPSSKFDRQEVLAVLQRLSKDTKQISFILAAGQAEPKDIDFAKLCEQIDFVPELTIQQTSQLVVAARLLCFAQSSSSCDLPRENPWGYQSHRWLEEYDTLRPLNAVTGLLSTPRSLKLALRRTYQAWVNVLEGEIDFDQLFVINSLRQTAPNVISFLSRNVDSPYLNSVRSGNRASTRKNTFEKRIKEEWQSITKSSEWNDLAVQAAIKFLLPELAKSLFGVGDSFSLDYQTVETSRYWLRAVNEEIECNGIKDQEILSEIEDWRKTKLSTCLMVMRLKSDYVYADQWYYFASRRFTDNVDIFQVASDYFAHFKSKDGVRVFSSNRIENGRRSAGFWEVCDLLRRRISRERLQEWVSKQIQDSLKTSLSLTVDLLSSFCGDRGCFDRESVYKLEQTLMNLAQQQINSAESLWDVCHPQAEQLLREWINPPKSMRHFHPKDLDWKWLGPILLDCLWNEDYQEYFGKEVVYLLTELETEKSGERNESSIRQDILDSVFSSKRDDLFDILKSLKPRFSDKIGSKIDIIINTPPK